jgi:hypothetical protein
MSSTKVRMFGKNANYRLPESWTNELIAEIRNLPQDDPKGSYLQQEVLSKFVSKETDPPAVRKARAIAKWLAAERENEATNVRLLTVHGEYNILPRVTYERFVAKSREFIEAIIGESPEDTDYIGGFSGGASTSKRRTESHPASKFLGQADITTDALHLWEATYRDLEAWTQFDSELSVREVRGNVMFTVPKNTEIDRVACKEPDLNMFLQRGLGTKIRKSLRRVGINLNDQTRNQSLAREGSLTGDLATLDLSSASDSVTCMLVEELLPIHWYASLNSIRSKVTMIGDEEHVNEMFSSMGNGFTFELESLLFYALARTTAYFRGVSGVISVYGDDIICPTTLVQDLISVLSFFGFTVNTKKSYWEGDFRESCGGHFVSGADVTPFYLRKPVAELTDLIHVANAIRHWALRDGDVQYCPEVYALWAKLRDRVPRSLWGGRETSSIVQLVTPDGPRSVLAPKKVKRDHGHGGYLHWLCSTREREKQGEVVTSSSDDVFPFYLRKRARMDWTKPWLTDYFYEEVAVMPSNDPG